MALTLSCAYVIFYIAEESLKVSGVLSTVFAGLFFCRFSPPIILHHRTMFSVWELVAWIGNTLLMFMAGAIIGFRSFIYIQPYDVAAVVIIYLYVFIIRGVMMAAIYPFISNIGKKCSLKEAVFMTWAGLRGAVSLALALSLNQEISQGNTIISEGDGHRVVFLVGGVSALTLIINALTSGPLLKKLDLIDSADESTENMIMRHYVKMKIKTTSKDLLREIELKHLDVSEDAVGKNFINIDLVRSFCSIFHEESEESINLLTCKRYAPVAPFKFNSTKSTDASVTSTPPRFVFASQFSSNSSVDSVVDSSCSMLDDLAKHLRGIFLEILRVNYW